jgi:GTP-binding protein HflX
MEEKKRALLVGANINNQSDFEESMDELGSLAAACEMNVVGRIDQNLKAVNTKYYIGKGKVEEIALLIDQLQADILIFDNELSPSQLRNLEKALSCSIIDRTSLILEIFAKRAETREAKLQVEAARLQYMLPRLVGAYEFMGQQTGGVGTISRGVGEQKLELDRRNIETRISELNKELELLVNIRQTQRKKRNEGGLPVVALVGYTNAGKSTLLNAMVELSYKPDNKKVFEKDMLFATLDTSVRNITLKDNKSFLLSDTVGFINKIPHNLIKAFRATLEEVKQADLLLCVADVSNPDHQKQIDVTNEVLMQIGIEGIPIIYVYNKADLTDLSIPFVRGNNVYISARDKVGLNELTQVISKYIFKEYVECRMLIPYDKGNIVSYLNENANIKSVSYETVGTLLTMECRESDYQRYKEFDHLCS